MATYEMQRTAKKVKSGGLVLASPVKKPEAKKGSKKVEKVEPKVVAKTTTKKPARAPIVVRDKMTKTKLVKLLMDNCDTLPSKKQVEDVLATLSCAMQGALCKKGLGEFIVPGLFKIVTSRIPAKPARRGVCPFTKVEKDFAAKPASTRVKIRPLSTLKKATAL